ncbi:LPXTG cell wall anchor domain-containing protein [Leifsonia shinshuensis]|uniref:beta strand repeat-containing protein n=1 Tax=Leifsonia shinshuensis TaxID=150026 RepID=UPI001F50538A|nr:putative Ig domain-containing protein [Leifsonia shinshuensis]MCI0157190.1 LPXTG cell wall anchor domain-containing protein [Leifsonia shinshuensis]
MPPSTVRRRLPLLAAGVAVALVAGLFGGVLPAEAAGTLTVSSTIDSDPNGACSQPGVTTQGSPATLRNALCVANNLGGAQSVVVPAGTYSLSASLGSLLVGTTSGADITITGQGAPTIVGDGQHQVFFVDPGPVGAVKATLDGLKVTGGVDNVYGGGALLGGSSDPARPDTLVIKNSQFVANKANTVGGTNNPGGAVQFVGGSLTVTGSTFQSNDAGTGSGGAIYYQSVGTFGQALSISDSTFYGNTGIATNATGGAAVAVSDPGQGAPLSVTNSLFSGNTVNGGSGLFRGAGLWLDGGALSVTGSTFIANQNSSAGGSAIGVTGGTVTAQYNRISGNSGTAVANLGGAITATRNWWGCAGGPGATGCDTVLNTVATAPYLTLTASASQSPVVQPATTTGLTASLLVDSAGASVPVGQLGALTGLNVIWTVAGIPGASVLPSAGPLATGQSSTTFSSVNPGTATVTAALDQAHVTVPVLVYAKPAITSTSPLTGIVGQAQSSVLTATGYPTPSFALQGTPPAGLSIVDHGDGTATLTGTPTGPAGDYSLTVAASNTAGTATQTIPYTLNQTPAFSSASSAQFAVGTAGSFTVTTTGRPNPTPITLAGTLPSGLTFTDNGNGTATIAGTPAAGAGGIVTVTLNAANGVGSPATQSLTLTVLEAPRLTSSAQTNALVGTAFAFTVTTAHSYPVPALSASGTLPPGVTFIDNGDGTATISGTPTGTGGSFPVLLGATSSAGSTYMTLTLVVAATPVITLAPAALTVGDGGTAAFTASATGYPAPTVQWVRSTDGGATYTAIAGATATTLSFTAALADNGYRYAARFDNASGTVTTLPATLTVTLTPTITSAAAAEFTAGTPGTFTVTTSGSPAPALSTTTTLPSWLTFTDNRDGTATISGTPAAGAGGTYPIAISAANGSLPDATQSFVLTVLQSSVFTSAAATTFTAGVSGSFTVTTTAGFPAARALSVSGSLPSGVRFVDLGDGTAVFTGTPAAGSGGVYAVTVSAANAPAPTVSQTFTLTVQEAGAVTSPATLAVERGVDVDFTVTTAHAYPAVAAITMTGTLPSGLTFTDNGDGTATIAGRTLDVPGTSTVALTAGAANQTLSVTVADVPPVSLPLVPPTGNAALPGVPSSPQAGQTIVLTAGGFAAGSPVTFGIYSSPVVLAVVNADVNGTATATIVIPAGYTGAHSFVAIGTAPDGSTRVLRTDFVLPGGSTGGSTGGGTAGAGAATGSGGSATASTGSGNGLADTGSDVGFAALLALLLLAAGGLLVVRRRARRA